MAGTIPRQRSIGGGIAGLFGAKQTPPRGYPPPPQSMGRRSPGPPYYRDQPDFQHPQQQRQQRYQRQYQSMPRQRPRPKPGVMGMFDFQPRQQRAPPPHHQHSRGGWQAPGQRSFDDSFDGNASRGGGGPPPPRSVTKGIGMVFGSKPQNRYQQQRGAPPPRSMSHSMSYGGGGMPPLRGPSPNNYYDGDRDRRSTSHGNHSRTGTMMSHSHSSPAIARRSHDGSESSDAVDGSGSKRQVGTDKSPHY